MQNHELDTKDIEILDLLQKDASISNVELAEKVHLSPSPCARRVKLLEEAGFFLRSVTLLNPEKLDKRVHVFINIAMKSKNRKTLRQFEHTVADWPEVMECYLMTGDFDYLLRISMADLDDYQYFLENKLTQIDEIDNIRTSFSIKQVQYKTEYDLSDMKKTTLERLKPKTSG